MTSFADAGPAGALPAVRLGQGGTAQSLISKYEPFTKRTSAWTSMRHLHNITEDEFKRDINVMMSTTFSSRDRKSWQWLVLGTAAWPYVVHAARPFVKLDHVAVTAAASAFSAYALVKAVRDMSPPSAEFSEPRICPLDPLSKRPIDSECVEHTGPAILSCYDRSGTLKTIDFMGVCDVNGENCMAPHSHWVGELWRFDAGHGKWKYLDGRGTGTAAISCDNAWESHRHEDGLTEPEPDFFEAFKGVRSYALHARQEHIVEGPLFSRMRSVMNDPGLVDMDFDKAQAKHWTNAGLLMLGYAKTMRLNAEKLNALRDDVFKWAFASNLQAVAQVAE